MSTKTNRRFFLCTGKAITIEWLQKHPGSHIIGELRHIVEEGNMVTSLAVYECSVPVTAPPATIPALRAEIVGNARHIKCTCCNRDVRWVISKAAIQNVIRRYLPE